MSKRRNGFTIVEIMVAIAIVGLLMGLAIPHVLNARSIAQQESCIGNLHQIDQAIDLWAIEAKALSTDVVKHTNLVAYLRKLPVCPTVKDGTFYSDYGMTYVREPAFCVENIALASYPHIIAGDGKVASTSSSGGNSSTALPISKGN